MGKRELNFPSRESNPVQYYDTTAPDLLHAEAGELKTILPLSKYLK